MDVELRHLRAFVALAEERHFGRAAERLKIAQPPLSRQIQDLERELGSELLDRRRRPVGLTPAGEAFLEEARVALEQSRRTVERARRAGRGQLWLSVAAPPWAFNGVLPAVLKAFRARHPEVGLELSTTDPVFQGNSLRDGAFDVVFAQWVVDTRGLALEPLLEEPTVALVPERHRLASRPALSLKDVAGEPSVAMCSRCTPKLAQEEATLFRSRGLTRHVVQSACGPLQQLGLVAAGLGIALSSASMSLLRREGVAFVPLETDTPSSSLHLLWRRDDERERLQRFLETAREVARSDMIALE
jgi:DNA-binding transcriptional LysR family regulator